ncbi:MAG: glycoside hydrolase family 3 C-terminal domain-containing protein [Bacteroidales bacterium]|nr:glycoside hydrolase family 3 C-terminal domain-containing protein [Bacteroidales bacterium]MDT8373140.1 glycoside hydrolase family 3 C-terminal domain-containing protein [Bacteroidales bacterium]
MKKITFFSVLILLMTQVQYAQIPAYLNKDLSFEERVNDLVSRMTLEEKAAQLIYTAPAIPRLGIPEYNWWNEALHGVARAGYATVFPQSITIANSWDEELMLDVANAISDEARAKYHEFLRRGEPGIYHGLTFWSPNINIFRDPRWGRGHETYGEDPYLTGRLGLRFVQGMQGSDTTYLKTVATAKHYAVHSGPEPLRHEFNAEISERDLRETYLPAFRTLVKEGGVYSVMGAYNQFRGHPACASEELYGILRNEWGFDGYIVSDCWAVSDFYRFQGYAEDAAEAAAQALKAGTDLECGVDYRHLMESHRRGLITEADIDRAVKRVMMARFRLGMFDPDSIVEYAQIPYQANCSDYNRSLARKAACESIVLLKNEAGLLPLKRGIRSIAVVGPNADNWEALVGNYNGIPKAPVTVLDGIRAKAGDCTEILYAEGSDLAPGIHNLVVIPSCFLSTPEGRQGVKGEYYDSRGMKGDPLFTRTDDNIDFYWENNSPHQSMPVNDFGIRWTTDLVPPVTGRYALGAWGSSDYLVIVEGDTLIRYRGEHHAFHKEVEIALTAGERKRIEIVYRNWGGDADMKLLWALPRENLVEEAVATASQADIVLLVLGLSQRLEGEEMGIAIDGFSGGDRTSLNLPKNQEELLEAMINTGKPVVVILMNGGPVASLQAEEKAAAVLLAGYPGVEGGSAVADVIFGDYNPAGRLPVTYYRSVDQLPPFDEYDMTNRTYRYFTGNPLYPFGYGLSYTTFGYSGFEMPEKSVAGSDVSVKVIVTNTGSMAGDEVVQLYLADEKASTPRPVRQLAGFRRIRLEPGESRVVDFVISAEQFSIIDDKEERVIEPGWFTVAVGGKQPGFTGSSDPQFTGVATARLRLTGREVRPDE